MPTFRSTRSQKYQWGVETVEGTAVPANKLLQTVSCSFDPQVTIDLFKAMGYNWPTIETLIDEFIGGDLEGRPDFNSIVYPLSSAVSAATITTPGGGTLSRNWAFKLLAQGDDPYKTFTIERGDASFVDRVAGLVLTDFSIHVGLDAIELGGAIMGRAIDTTGTLTASPTAVPVAAMNGLQFAVYADDTSAGIGTTKLTDCFDFNFGISGRRNRVKVIDRALGTNAVATIAADADSDCAIQIAQNSTGNALFAKMRAGQGKYIRLEALGPIIELAITYKMTIDFYGLIGDAPSEDDVNGVMVNTWPFRVAADAAWSGGTAALINVVNTLTAL